MHFLSTDNLFIGHSNLVGASIYVPLQNPLSQDAESPSNVTLSQDAESNVTLSPPDKQVSIAVYLHGLWNQI